MAQDVFVLFTMDVEPAAARAGMSGPASDEVGMRAVHDYQEVLRSRGYRPTCFVHPELLCAYPEFFRQLASAGADLGLHVHTTKFAPAKQSCELGGLSAAKQQALLREAADMFEQGLGYRPALFRPGCFSANDATYGVLAALGFTGGSISIPERIWPERFCVWSGACPYAHWAHEAFRQSPGTLPFVEIPLSVDLTLPPRWNPVGFRHCPDLRPGGVYSDIDEVPHDRRTLLRNILRQMATDDPPVKTLVVDVHNDRDFTSPDSPAATHLSAVLEGIEPECRELGLRPVPSTYVEVVRHYTATEPRGMQPQPSLQHRQPH